MICSNIAFIVLLLGVMQQVTFAQTQEEIVCIKSSGQAPKCFSDGTLERQGELSLQTPTPETCEPATLETYLTTVLYGESYKCLEELVREIDAVLDECVKAPEDRATYKQGLQQFRELSTPASFCAALGNCATECVPVAEKVAAAAVATTPPTQGGSTLAPQSSGADATTIGLIVGGSVLAAVVGSVLVVSMNNKQASYAMAPASPSKMMSGPPQIQLPPGWNSATDPVNGRTYYYNQQGHTQWTIPM